VNSVSREYDAWTTEGILEDYWGEHIHLGYYTEAERAAGYKKKDFIQAKYDFIDEMIKFGGITADTVKPVAVLDVGCGIGGTTRYLAKKYGSDTQVTGITISPAQQRRATQLAKERGIANADFQVVDALNMTFPDNSFDIVWACESGEHMPDKARYAGLITVSDCLHESERFAV
jgi:MPBQ/MSBQ methyltransferase